MEPVRRHFLSDDGKELPDRRVGARQLAPQHEISIPAAAPQPFACAAIEREFAEFNQRSRFGV